MITRKVKFYWWQSYKISEIKGKDMQDIIETCYSLCEKYEAIHFEVLEK